MHIFRCGDIGDWKIDSEFQTINLDDGASEMIDSAFRSNGGPL